MAADALTKKMKSPQLEMLVTAGQLAVSFVKLSGFNEKKNNECESHFENMMQS